jgi:ferredoxin
MKVYFKVLLHCVLLLAFIVAGSYFVSGLWGDKPEKIDADRTFAFSAEMTALDFARANGLPEPALGAALGLNSREGLERSLASFGLSEAELSSRVQKSLALHNEESSKNWKKIALKFALWVLFLGAVFVFMRRGIINSRLRNGLYLAAIAIFGVALGSDPSPMGTVKDAIVLFGAKGVFFPPRLAALAVFLLLVILANKFICSWGCQLGVLQDLLFRLSRDKSGRSVLRQYKPSFAVTNTVRIIFLCVFTAMALIWGFDIVEPVDPFKIYNPAVVKLSGWLFISALLSASLFVYRPWCHLLCPFGLAGWLAEKVSVYKIKVNYSTCISCGACEKVCPSTVMGAILKRDRPIPDCFACGECQAVCPTKSISLSSGARELPPAGKFKSGN